MGEAAVRGVLAAGYVGAGTVEFLVDDHDRFSFMEVNCRIQVEHPVTELTYGVDLVREQLRIAAGEPLGSRPGRPGAARRGDRVPDQRRGPGAQLHAHARPLDELTLPGGPFVRVDTDARAGGRISACYDPLLAKVVVWAPDRPQALARMRRALDEFHAEGPGRVHQPGLPAHGAGASAVRRRHATTRPCWTGSGRPTDRQNDRRKTHVHHRRPDGSCWSPRSGLPTAGRAPTTRTRRSPTWGWTRSPSSSCRPSSRNGTASSFPTTGPQSYTFGEIVADVNARLGRTEESVA